MWAWLRENDTPLEALGAILTGIVALVATVVAFHQLTSQWDIEQTKAAKDAHRSFLEVSLANPELANPSLRILTPVEQEKYIWYVAIMSSTFEEVLAFAPEQSDWMAIAAAQVKLHCHYFNSPQYKPSLHSGAFQSLVSTTLATLKPEFCEAAE